MIPCCSIVSKKKTLEITNTPKKEFGGKEMQSVTLNSHNFFQKTLFFQKEKSFFVFFDVLFYNFKFFIVKTILNVF